MGSTNPGLGRSHALERRGDTIARGLVGSFTASAGQFCTKPGLVFLPDGDGAERFLAALTDELLDVDVGPLLDDRLTDRFRARARESAAADGVTVVHGGPPAADARSLTPMVLRCAADVWREDVRMRDECFGPLLMVVTGSLEDHLKVARGLAGNLTGTIHSDANDASYAEKLCDVLLPRVGRLVFDGVPTGVAVTWSMHHGGPCPTTTSPLHTSVGATAVRRFQRPITFQDAPADLLPPALQDDNPWELPRRVDGQLRLAARSRG